MATTIDPKMIDFVLPVDEQGYPVAQQMQDTRDVLIAKAQEAGAVVTAFPEHMWVEPRDWPERARQNDENRTWPIDYLDRFTNQGQGNGGYSTHECTTHCFVKCFESARNRQRKIVLGPPVPRQRLPISETAFSVWMSCLSVYAEANPGQWGGAGVRQILSIAARRGLIPDKIQPRDWGFKHTLQGTCGAGGVNQSRGSWVSVSNFPDGWEETAKWFKPLEYIFPESWEQTVCLVLNGIAVGVGRSGHSVPYMKWKASDNVMEYPDSYDIFRYDSTNMIRATVGGSYGIVSVVTPDDWAKPSG